MSILKMIEQHERYLEHRISVLETEVEEWRAKYNDLLHSSIKHGDDMFGLLLQGAMNGAFTPRSESPQSMSVVDPVGELAKRDLATRD